MHAHLCFPAEMELGPEILFYVSLKGLCYIYKKACFWVSILKLTQNEIYTFVPNSRKLYLILV